MPFHHVPSPITTGSLQDRIRASVERDILDGLRLPGSPIDERALAETFGTSRTPVREAMLVLATLGLVQIVPRSGIHVRRASAAELAARLEALQEIEAAVAGLAARRASAVQMAELRSALAATSRLAEAGTPKGYGTANGALHEVIYRACGNDILVDQVRSLRRSLAAYRLRGPDHAARLKASDAGHQAIVAAICKGDAAAAMLAMRDHVVAGGEALLDLVQRAAALDSDTVQPAAASAGTAIGSGQRAARRRTPRSQQP